MEQDRATSYGFIPKGTQRLGALQSTLESLPRPTEGWLSLLLLMVMFMTTVNVVENAHWVQQMPSLGWLAIVALVTGYVLAKVRIHALFLHPASLLVGAVAITWGITSIAAGEDFKGRLVDSAVRMYLWYETARDGGISTDPLPFVFQLVVLTWFVGYFSSWFVFRNSNCWLGIVPCGVALLINLNYLPGRFTIHYAIFLLAALLLMTRLTLEHKERQWRMMGATSSLGGDLSLMWNAFLVVGVVIALAWQVPLVGQEAPLMNTWDQVAGPWRQFERNFDRLYAGISAGQVSPLHSFSGSLPLRGSVNLGDDLINKSKSIISRYDVFKASTNDPGYWRGESYDVYNGRGWVASEKEMRSIPGTIVGTDESRLELYERRKNVISQIEVGTPGEVLFSRGLPTYSDRDSVASVGTTNRYVINFSGGSQENQRLPKDIRELVPRLRTSLNEAGRLLSAGEIQRVLPSDLVLEQTGGITLRGSEVSSIHVVRRGAGTNDIWSLRALNRQGRFQKYTVASSVSLASADDLSQAGEDYPGWVKDRFLQLPDTVPQRVRELARVWTDGAATPYDKAAVIETRLREYPYTLRIEAPPLGEDAVDYFLFQLGEGYADYHATAMVVLLRSLGIPARIAVGYVSGDFDPEKDLYTIKETHAHTWTEVFFPNFGWIEFNPTPNWPSLSRGGSDLLPDSEEPSEEDEGDLGLSTAPEDEFDLGLEGGSNASVSKGISPKDILAPVGLIGLVALAVFLTGRTVWLYGLSGLSMAVQTYEKMCRLAVLANVRPRANQTPYEYSRSISEQVPGAEEHIKVVVDGYTRDWYGKKPMSDEERRGVQRAWIALRGVLLRKVLRWKGK